MLQHLMGPPPQAGATNDVRCEEEPIPARAAVSRAKRAFDLAASLLLMPLLGLAMAAIGLAVKLTSKGPVLYWSDRVGRNNRIFRMPKFRTMKFHTPEVASHLLRNPETHLTLIGPFLRKTSLDELPQIYSILKGDLSFVGPRPDSITSMTWWPLGRSVECMSSFQGLRAGPKSMVETTFPFP